MKSALLLVSCALVAACAATGDRAVESPALAIPSYPADDPRPQTGRFVREVRLAETTVGETRFILMAFRVGDTLTLGAMTEGPFEGSANFRLGKRGLEFDFAADHGEIAVTTTNPPAGAERPRGQQAGFRDYRWINVELESDLWLPDGATLLGLRFRDRLGQVTTLPVTGGAFAARLEAR